MTHKNAAAKVDRLRAVTVERGATAAEAATAASLAQRFISRMSRCNDRRVAADVVRRAALAPGVHVNIV